MKEAKENRISFSDDDTAAMIGVVMHLYGYNLSEWQQAVCRGHCRYMQLFTIHGLALKYDLPQLANDASHAIETMMNYIFGAKGPWSSTLR